MDPVVLLAFITVFLLMVIVGAVSFLAGAKVGLKRGHEHGKMMGGLEAMTEALKAAMESGKEEVKAESDQKVKRKIKHEDHDHVIELPAPVAALVDKADDTQMVIIHAACGTSHGPMDPCPADVKDGEKPALVN